jgi:hypothetical protein
MLSVIFIRIKWRRISITNFTKPNTFLDVAWDRFIITVMTGVIKILCLRRY